jgi:hypothetical protein
MINKDHKYNLILKTIKYYSKDWNYKQLIEKLRMQEHIIKWDENLRNTLNSGL